MKNAAHKVFSSDSEEQSTLFACNLAAQDKYLHFDFMEGKDSFQGLRYPAKIRHFPRKGGKSLRAK